MAVAVLACGLAAPGALGGRAPQTAGLAYVTATATGLPSVWVAAANGRGAHRLGPGGGPKLSPNGRLVAVALLGARHSAFGIYRVGGGLAWHMFRPSRFTATVLAWSPDSRYVSVYVNDGDTGENVGQSALDVIDTSTGKISASVGGIIAGASFAPGGADRVVFGRAQSQLLSAAQNLYEVAADGTGPVTQVTTDGRSINPVWGKLGIAFDRVTLRPGGGPVYQITLLSGSQTMQITHTHPSLPLDGLQPVAVSGNGVNLLAEYVGTDTDQAYAVNLRTHKVRRLAVKGQYEAAGFAISRNGRRVLLSAGPFGPLSGYTVYTEPFTGGKATVLVRPGAEPSWNR
jgi:hypothetical protein